MVTYRGGRINRIISAYSIECNVWLCCKLLYDVILYSACPRVCYEADCFVYI